MVDRLAQGERVVLLGAGGHAMVVVDAVRSVGAEVIGYVDPAESEYLWDIPWLGSDSEFLSEDRPTMQDLVLGIGLLSVRRALITEFAGGPYRFPALVHARAYVADSVSLGHGVQVMAGAVVQPFSQISDHAILNTRTVVEHECHVGENSHVAPGAVLLGNVKVASDVLIGGASVVLQGVRLGEGSVVGAGAAVIEDVEAGVVVMGVPARAVQGAETSVDESLSRNS